MPTAEVVTGPQAAAGTAGEAVVRWLECLAQGRYGDAVAWAQKTWVSDCEARWRTSPEAALGQVLADADVLEIGAAVLSTPIAMRAAVLQDATCTLRLRIGEDEGDWRLHCRLLKEAAPYRPRPNGRWGVCPTSLRLERLPV